MYINYCKRFLWAAMLAAVGVLTVGCADDILGDAPAGSEEINLSGDISQTYVSRANDSGFADGDRMGIYIVDRDNGAAGTLMENGNRASNVIYTYNAETGRWKAGSTVYWKDDRTAIDVYGYYPFDNAMESVTEHLFSVETDQSSAGGAGSMGGYEKSDFLWAKKENVAPTSNTIFLNYEHRMAGVKVVLQQGEGFSGDEWQKVKRIVTVESTVRSGKIDLTTGTVKPDDGGAGQIIACPQGDDVWRAVVVPQIVDGGKALIGVTIDGTSYIYTREEATKLAQGKMHTFTLRISKKEDGAYAVALVAQSIEEWENDNTSHNFEASAYTTIDCPKEGTFEECIRQSGKIPGEILNLKVVGRMNGTDFEFLRNNMPQLRGLNLHDLVPVEYVSSVGDIGDKIYSKHLKIQKENDNFLPGAALADMRNLRHIVLPKNLIALGNYSLGKCGLSANSTLVIPNSVKIIEDNALREIMQGFMELPDSVEYIGGYAFHDNRCYFEWKFGNTVKHIGRWAFCDAIHCTGYFKLPENLEFLGDCAFGSFGENLMGEINIPASITVIPYEAFRDMRFANGTKITLHDGITRIDKQGFQNLTINNRLIWPAHLRIIGSEAFENSRFRGGMDKIPESVEVMGNKVFSNCQYLPEEMDLPRNLSRINLESFRFTDIKSIDLPENVDAIGNEAFYYCQNLQSISMGAYVDDIGDRAFFACEALKSIRCLATTPPALGEDVFGWCDFDHLILEVPEKSVNAYRNAEGWGQIKYITAYHELAVSLSNITCLDKGISREMMVRSEGAWEVQSCPSWVHLSKTSSNINTTELTVKVDASSSAREGEIVFKLKNNNYTTTCNIKQYIAATGEDKEIVLQTASAGATPIPIFIVGDGFTAEQLADGTYLSRVKEQMEHFFAIEPFKTYRNYFTVSTALAASPEKGISSPQTIVRNRFNTTYDPMGAMCGDVGYRCNYDELKDYAANVSQGINYGNINNVLFMIVMNQDNCAGDAWIDDSGATFAFAANSPDPYPYDTRGLVQHYAGGKGFGRLAPENVEHFDFLKACTCLCCNGITRYYAGRAKGWYGNVSLNGSMNTVPWSHLIFDPRYSDIVDVFEGGYRHARGTFRSENMSVMSNYIQYFNTYSRELIVRRIMQLAGRKFDFEEFVRKDSREGLPQ